MAKRVKKNKYKTWFFFLLFINVSFLGYQYIETPSILNNIKFFYRQLFQAPNIPEGNYIYGIDVSEYQGIIAWDQLKEINKKKQVSFVLIRATAGKNHRDRFFTSNWRKSANKDLVRGAYHYFRPNENSSQQAINFIKNVKLSTGDLPPILDIERTSNVQSLKSLKVGVQNWMKLVEDHYGIKPILYTGAHYYKDHLKNDFKDYNLWVANYNNVSQPLTKHKWMMWQFSDNGSISGIKGPVDLDLFKGTVTELKKYALK